VLPYDSDGYVARIKGINSIDPWEVFYIEQALKCYNVDALEASIMMLGLAGEFIAESLVEMMRAFLNKNEPAMTQKYEVDIDSTKSIAVKYGCYESRLKMLEKVKNNSALKYSGLAKLKPNIDNSAKPIYATYVRLSRNQLAHPSGLKMDRMECLMMFITFIRYCEIQHDYLDFYQNNS
jgi:hypothetical protein